MAIKDSNSASSECDPAYTRAVRGYTHSTGIQKTCSMYSELLIFMLKDTRSTSSRPVSKLLRQNGRQECMWWDRRGRLRRKVQNSSRKPELCRQCSENTKFQYLFSCKLEHNLQINDFKFHQRLLQVIQRVKNIELVRRVAKTLLRRMYNYLFKINKTYSLLNQSISQLQQAGIVGPNFTIQLLSSKYSYNDSKQRLTKNKTMPMGDSIFKVQISACQNENTNIYQYSGSLRSVNLVQVIKQFYLFKFRGFSKSQQIIQYQRQSYSGARRFYSNFFLFSVVPQQSQLVVKIRLSVASQQYTKLTETIEQ
ncbi:hypothetical protein SS50377_20218 [Spironucleus salmonicida]|uniref:Uncharacterized protein n=1 Tax=Spironucleus salmonicida TaxID=348837 RepID=V6LWU4_9EUKA|nr:hypothetical protein SS50377_20218 [Spironucleus salmonicida]|eukprot:EST45274.1 Hypothetical protein SS50377_14850 [Spironucleus salmonicida]